MQWKIPVLKPSTRKIAMQSTKPKWQAEVGPSTNKNNLADNTRKAATCTQASGSTIVPKIPRRI